MAVFGHASSSSAYLDLLATCRTDGPVFLLTLVYLKLFQLRFWSGGNPRIPNSQLLWPLLFPSTLSFHYHKMYTSDEKIQPVLDQQYLPVDGKDVHVQTKELDQRKTPDSGNSPPSPLSQSSSMVEKWWLFEFFAWFLGTIGLIVIVIILRPTEGKPTPNWYIKSKHCSVKLSHHQLGYFPPLDSCQINTAYSCDCWHESTEMCMLSKRSPPE